MAVMYVKTMPVIATIESVENVREMYENVLIGIDEAWFLLSVLTQDERKRNPLTTREIAGLDSLHARGESFMCYVLFQYLFIVSIHLRFYHQSFLLHIGVNRYYTDSQKETEPLTHGNPQKHLLIG